MEAEETFSLNTVDSLQDAVNTILKYLGMGVCNNTEKVPEGTHTHTLLAAGELK